VDAPDRLATGSDMTVELSPENVETIARRVVELLHARDTQQWLGSGGERSPMMSSPPSSSPSLYRPGYPRRARGSVPLLPIRGYDGDGRWIDIEYDPTGKPIQRAPPGPATSDGVSAVGVPSRQGSRQR
jgi:hypothetical protein